MSLLLSGCGRQQDSAKIAQKPYPYPEVTLSSPGNEVARAESLAHANRLVKYRNSKYGYNLRYDNSQVRINAWQSEEGVDFLRGSSRIAEVSVIHDRDLRDFIPRDSLGVQALLGTGLLPDTLDAAAMLYTVNGCAAGGPNGDGGLEMPPTRISHDTNSFGIRFTKLWCDYVTRSLNKSTAHYPAGPFYLVDISLLTRPALLQIRYDCSRVAPKDVETFLDTLVNSVEVEHR
jgi:hypothetical protein